MHGARDSGTLVTATIGSASLDTVLGLSMTPTTAAWVLVEGHDADVTILDHDAFRVRAGSGVRAVNTSQQVAAAVLRAREMAADHDGRLHLVGVTWSDGAAAEAALLLESLTGEGFDNVVPVRRLESADALARGLAPIIGYERTAVCVLGRESTTVVLVSNADDATRTTIKHVYDGTSGLIRWLTTMFERSRWLPDGVVVVGSQRDLDAITRRLEDALPVPVLTQVGAELAFARGAALASAQRTQFTDAGVVATRADHSARHARPRSYAGGLTMLGAGAATLVVSLSLAVGLRLEPQQGPGPVERAGHTSPTPSAAEPVAPPVAPPPAVGTQAAKATPGPAPTREPPVDPPASEPPSVGPRNELADHPAYQTPTSVSAAEPANTPPPEQPPSPAQAVPPEPPPDPQPLLTRLLDRLHGGHGDPPAQQPAAPDAGMPAP